MIAVTWSRLDTRLVCGFWRMLNSYPLETAFWLETSLLRMPSTWSRVCSAVSLFYTVRILSTELLCNVASYLFLALLLHCCDYCWGSQPKRRRLVASWCCSVTVLALTTCSARRIAFWKKSGFFLYAFGCLRLMCGDGRVWTSYCQEIERSQAHWASSNVGRMRSQKAAAAEKVVSPI